jgi:hypothetical protein
MGPHLYVLPQSAVPYLGSTLDPALFDVTDLAKHPSDPIRVTFRSASSPAKVPGIAITYRSGITAEGTNHGRAFGTALAQQALRDHASPTHTTGLFADVARISPVTTAPPVAQPHYPMHTLTIKGIDHAGGPDTGDPVLVYNVDDVRKYAGFAIFNKGIAKVSVPAGHYGADAFFFERDANVSRQSFLPQFSIRGDATVALDARKATTPVTASTPKPAAPALKTITYGRFDASGSGLIGDTSGGPDTAMFVQPVTKPVTVGGLHYAAKLRAIGPDYSYDLVFPSEGTIPVRQHYVVRAADLATVDSSYPASHTEQRSMDYHTAFLPWQQFAFVTGVEFTTPTRRTEYYTARPDVTWNAIYVSDFSDEHPYLGMYVTGARTYEPGTTDATTWGGAAGHPRLTEQSVSLRGSNTVCPACVSGSRLDVLGYPFGDNAADHAGYPDDPTPGLTEALRYGIYADGQEVATDTTPLDTDTTLPDGTRTLRIDYDTARTSADFQLSTDVKTRWTVPTSAPTGALPDGWVCADHANPPTDCRVLPLITSSYDLPVNLLGQLRPGAATASLNLGHLAAANAVAFTSAKVKVSFDDGKTWRSVSTTAHDPGRYGLSFKVPTGARFGALQVSARDAFGGTFTQTIQHAFAIGE